MAENSPDVRYACVAFDAVGTLIEAEPPVVDVYCLIGQKYGADLSQNDARIRFGKAFASRELSHETDETSEYAFWKVVVHEVLGEVGNPEACFNELYDHFANPKSWRVNVDAEDLFQALTDLGIEIAIASNFDHRLNSVIDGHAALKRISHRIISSEIGWRKPSRNFYSLLCEKVQVQSNRILMVGDDFENDVKAARNAGLDAIQLVANNEAIDPDDQICSLKETLMHVIENG